MTERSFGSAVPVRRARGRGGAGRRHAAWLTILNESDRIDVAHSLGRLAAIAVGDPRADGAGPDVAIFEGASAVVFLRTESGITPAGAFSGSGIEYADGLLTDGDGDGDLVGLAASEGGASLENAMFGGPTPVPAGSARLASGLLDARRPRVVVVAGGSELVFVSASPCRGPACATWRSRSSTAPLRARSW